MGELSIVDALRNKRSELVGVMSRLEQQLAHHRGSLTHLDDHAAVRSRHADNRTRALIQKTVLASLSRAQGSVERTKVDGMVSWRVRQAA